MTSMKYNRKMFYIISFLLIFMLVKYQRKWFETQNLTYDLAYMSKKIKILEDLNIVLTGRIEELETSNNVLVMKTDDLEAINTELRTLVADKEAIVVSHNILQNTVQHQTETIQNLEDRVHHQTTTIQALEMRLATLEGDLEEAKSTMELAISEYEKLAKK
jgi:chromosome segregation ATPase